MHAARSTQSTTPATPTIRPCVFCGNDCSGVPRVKNARGDYACKACLPGNDGGIIALSPLDTSDMHRAPCPRCGSETKVGVPSCPQCGYAPPRDPGSPGLRRPKPGKLKPPAAPKCRGCGYDLSGLKENVCPECGKEFSIFVRKDWDEEISREAMVNAYRKPIIMACAGMGVSLLVLGLHAQWGAMLGVCVLFAVTVTVGFCVALACCATWLGFSSSLPLMAVQLAGIHGVCLGLNTLLGLLNFAGFVWAMGITIVYIYLMSELLEMDPYDARIVGILSAVANIGVFLGARVLGWI